MTGNKFQGFNIYRLQLVHRSRQIRDQGTTCYGVLGNLHSHLTSAGARSGLALAAVEKGQNDLCTTSSDVPITAGALVVATVVVDEDSRRLLITRRTIRTPIKLRAGNGKGAVPL